MKILVIDDYRPHGESLRELLESRGHEALYAESLDDAGRYLDTLRFDLAFLDFDMPRLKGTSVAARLASRFPRLRSVIVSARELDPDQLQREGGFLYLRKPVSLEALGACLQRLERERIGSALVRRAALPLVPYRPAPDTGKDTRP